MTFSLDLDFLYKKIDERMEMHIQRWREELKKEEKTCPACRKDKTIKENPGAIFNCRAEAHICIREIYEPKLVIVIKGKTELLNISEKGIKFNREVFPTDTPDDFANAFIDILENGFDIKFTKNKNETL